MSIELREPGQITRRKFFDLAAKAVAALAVAGTVGKFLAEEAVETVAWFNRHTHGAVMNVAMKFSAEQGWVIGASYVDPESGDRVFEAMVDQEQSISPPTTG